MFFQRPLLGADISEQHLKYFLRKERRKLLLLSQHLKYLLFLLYRLEVLRTIKDNKNDNCFCLKGQYLFVNHVLSYKSVPLTVPVISSCYWNWKGLMPGGFFVFSVCLCIWQEFVNSQFLCSPSIVSHFFPSLKDPSNIRRSRKLF